jgi:hypothetical protein
MVMMIIRRLEGLVLGDSTRVSLSPRHEARMDIDL